MSTCTAIHPELGVGCIVEQRHADHTGISAGAKVYWDNEEYTPPPAPLPKRTPKRGGAGALRDQIQPPVAPTPPAPPTPMTPEKVIETMEGVLEGQETIEAGDHLRLGQQMAKVMELMSDGQWRTLAEIAAATASPEASVSARLRDLRKPEFGEVEVERERLASGLHRYRVIHDALL